MVFSLKSKEFMACKNAEKCREHLPNPELTTNPAIFS
jgi:hypothetical protein